MQVRIKKLDEKAIVPTYGTEYSAGRLRLPDGFRKLDSVAVTGSVEDGFAVSR